MHKVVKTLIFDMCATITIYYLRRKVHIDEYILCPNWIVVIGSRG